MARSKASRYRFREQRRDGRALRQPARFVALPLAPQHGRAQPAGQQRAQFGFRCQRFDLPQAALAVYALEKGADVRLGDVAAALPVAQLAHRPQGVAVAAAWPVAERARLQHRLDDRP